MMSDNAYVIDVTKEDGKERKKTNVTKDKLGESLKKLQKQIFGGTGGTVSVGIQDNASSVIYGISQDLENLCGKSYEIKIDAVVNGSGGGKGIISKIGEYVWEGLQNHAGSDGGSRGKEHMLGGKEETDKFEQAMNEHNAKSIYPSDINDAIAKRLVANGVEEKEARDFQALIENTASSNDLSEKDYTKLADILMGIKDNASLYGAVSQMGNMGIPAKKILNESLGQPSENADKTMQHIKKGFIDFDTAFQSFKDGLQKVFGENSEQRTKTYLPDALTALGNKANTEIFDKMIGGFGEGLKQGIFDFMTWVEENGQLFSDLGTSLQTLSNSLGVSASEAIGTFTTNLDAIIGQDKFKQADFTGKIIILWDELIQKPFVEWWQSTGLPFFSKALFKIGFVLSQGFSAGLMIGLKTDWTKVIDNLGSLGLDFTKGVAWGSAPEETYMAAGKALDNLIGSLYRLTPGGEKAGLSSFLLGGWLMENRPTPAKILFGNGEEQGSEYGATDTDTINITANNVNVNGVNAGSKKEKGGGLLGQFFSKDTSDSLRTATTVGTTAKTAASVVKKLPLIGGALVGLWMINDLMMKRTNPVYYPDDYFVLPDQEQMQKQKQEQQQQEKINTTFGNITEKEESFLEADKNKEQTQSWINQWREIEEEKNKGTLSSQEKQYKNLEQKNIERNLFQNNKDVFDGEYDLKENNISSEFYHMQKYNLGETELKANELRTTVEGVRGDYNLIESEILKQEGIVESSKKNLDDFYKEKEEIERGLFNAKQYEQQLESATQKGDKAGIQKNQELLSEEMTKYQTQLIDFLNKNFQPFVENGEDTPYLGNITIDIMKNEEAVKEAGTDRTKIMELLEYPEKSLQEKYKGNKESYDELISGYETMYYAEASLIKDDLEQSKISMQQAQQQLNGLNETFDYIPENSKFTMDIIVNWMNNGTPPFTLEQKEKDGFSIFPHAKGGIFSSPHVGLVAEAGPEAIIPLSGVNKSNGISLWEQAGYILGTLPKHAEGGIFGEIDEEKNGRSSFLSNNFKEEANNAESVSNITAPIQVNTNITGMNFTFQGAQAGDKEGIMQVIKEQMPTIADEIAGTIAVNIQRIFANMKKGAV